MGKKMRVVYDILMLIALFGIVAIIGKEFAEYNNMPIVQYSAATLACKKVVVGDCDCDSLPEKYIIEWVE